VFRYEGGREEGEGEEKVGGGDAGRNISLLWSCKIQSEWNDKAGTFSITPTRKKIYAAVAVTVLLARSRFRPFFLPGRASVYLAKARASAFLQLTF